jgi:hypothetical protein
MIGRNNRDDFNAIRPFGLSRSHLRKAAVRARNAQIRCGGQTHFGIRAQRRRHQFVPVIESRRHTMHGANECSRPASDHAKA